MLERRVPLLSNQVKRTRLWTLPIINPTPSRRSVRTMMVLLVMHRVGGPTIAIAIVVTHRGNVSCPNARPLQRRPCVVWHQTCHHARRRLLVPNNARVAQKEDKDAEESNPCPSEECTGTAATTAPATGTIATVTPVALQQRQEPKWNWTIGTSLEHENKCQSHDRCSSIDSYSDDDYPCLKGHRTVSHYEDGVPICFQQSNKRARTLRSHGDGGAASLDNGLTVDDTEEHNDKDNDVVLWRVDTTTMENRAVSGTCPSRHACRKPHETVTRGKPPLLDQ